MKSFRNIVWINFFVAIIAVNVVAEVGYFYTGIYIPIPLRLAFIAGVTVGMTVLVGSMFLVMNMSEEVPHATYAKDTLGFERNRKHSSEDLKKLERIEGKKTANPPEEK